MNNIQTRPHPDLELHHVGFTVENIEEYLAGSIWTLKSRIVIDPIQRCRLCLVGASTVDEGKVELVEPIGEESPAYRIVKSGGRQFHLCFLAETMEAGDRVFHRHRMLPVTDWQPAVLFGGRHVRFAYSRNRELMEILADE